MKAEIEERFAALVVDLEREPGVSRGEPRIKAFGHSALKVDGKIFAMLSSSDRFVLKLPKDRVDTLVALEAGQKFEAGKGRPMREWIAMDPGSEGLDGPRSRGAALRSRQALIVAKKQPEIGHGCLAGATLLKFSVEAPRTEDGCGHYHTSP